MSLIILKEEGKERETEQQQLNPNIAPLHIWLCRGSTYPFFQLFQKKKLVSNTKGDWTAVAWQVTLIGKICKKLWFEMNDFLRNIFCPQCVVK